MKQTKCLTRLLSLALVCAMLFGFAVPLRAADAGQTRLDFETVDNHAVPLAAMPAKVDETAAQTAFAATDTVRVSIVLEGKSTLDAGFATKDIAQNDAAQSYRESLRSAQAEVAGRIGQAMGEELDVVWNLTLAANIISAWVPYGQLETIASVPGVRQVSLETRYAPCVIRQEETADPNTATSGTQIGSPAAYSAGYTGAGSRIAVIDTGIEVGNRSFAESSYQHSLSQLAALEGMEPEAYLEKLGLLDAEEIGKVLEQLNVYALYPQFDAKSYYENSKIPFRFNYVDGKLNSTHELDMQGEHGSHVAGIASANRYIANEDGTFSTAMDTTRVQGVAPDAQLLIMKVFGANGGAYDSDYMAAMEDAIVLGADSVNLSLGSSAPGFVQNRLYQDILDALTESDTVVCMSGGNSGHYARSGSHAQPGYLYADDVNMNTTGSPGTSTNSVSVASSDNVGLTYYSFQVGSETFVYSETSMADDPYLYNYPLSYALPGEREYVFLDGYGTDAELAALADVIKGKIVFLSRGGEIAFSDKAETAVKYGAYGTIIYNNQPGIVFMDMSGYAPGPSDITWPPVAGVTQKQGNRIRDLSTPVKDDAGQVLYYTGKMVVADFSSSEGIKPEVLVEGKGHISSFSSWGVPGTLTLKPEITAPGGNIYSVNGKHKVGMGEYAGGGYETMSGTSMASPQVAGMAALVAQYIRENQLDKKTGMGIRALSQSLLMSTAEPLPEENSDRYAPVLRQGAGQANVGAAVSSQSWIQMGQDATASWADGKVKAELGDDPERTGTYSFHFTLSNLTDELQKYVLRADFFTQGLFRHEGISYLDTQTVDLAAQVTWTVNGQQLVPEEDVSNFDFNGDGLVNGADAEALLACAIHPESAVQHPELADMNGDGEITSYDAYLFLGKVSTGTMDLAPNGKAEIQVTVQLTDAQKQELNDNYKNGAYVQGYVFAQQLATAEGVQGVTHSIPVLAFYGSWTDASMYDKLTHTAYLHGDTTLPYTNMEKVNNLIIQYFDEPGSQYYHVGNPYQRDDTYLPERNAINSGSSLWLHQVTLIRNAAALTTVVTNEQGEILYMGPVHDQVYGAYYPEGGSSWQNTFTNAFMRQRLDVLDVQEGDRIAVSVVAIPEYYENDGPLTMKEIRSLIETNALGRGAYLTTELTVDNTAPAVGEVWKNLENGNLKFTVRDNEYLAMLQVTDHNGNVLGEVNLDGQEPGKPFTAEVDLTGKTVGAECFIVAGDYARNQITYRVKYGGQSQDDTGKMFGFTKADARGYKGPRWISIEPSKVHMNGSNVSFAKVYGGTENVCVMDFNVLAAEYVDGYVYMASDDGWIYVAKQGDWSNCSKASYYYGQTGSMLEDLAYNYTDQTLYALDSNNWVYTVDLITGRMASAFSVSVVNPYTTSSRMRKLICMAIDDNGNFYAVNYGTTVNTYLFRWSKQDIVDGAVTNLYPVGGQDKNAKTGYNNQKWSSLAWDHDADILYFCSSNTDGGSTSCKMLYFDLQTGAAKKTNETYVGDVESPPTEGNLRSWTSLLGCSVNGLYIVPQGATKTISTDTATDMLLGSSVALENGALSLVKGNSAQLVCEVLPWCLTDKSVTWTSSDETVAEVKDGLVTGKKPGSATITVTTGAQPNLQTQVTVNVVELPPVTLKGMIYDGMNVGNWASFSTGAPEQWQAISEKTDAFYYGGTRLNQTIYVHDGTHLYGIDAKTFEARNYGQLASSWQWSDAAPAPYNADFNAFGQLAAIGDNGGYFTMLDPENGTLSYYSFSGGKLATLAYWYSDLVWSGTVPCIYFLALTEDGLLYQIQVQKRKTDSDTLNVYFTKLGQVPMQLEGVAMLNEGRYASMTYDAATGYAYLSTFTGEKSAELYAIEIAKETYRVSKMGEFGDGTHPVVALYQDDQPVSGSGAVTPAPEDQATLAGVVSMDVAAAQPSGSANAAQPTVEPNTVVEENIVLNLTGKDANGMDVASTNGLVTVTYDASHLELKNLQLHAGYKAVAQEEGKLTFAYADEEALNRIATLTFVEKMDKRSSIVVETKQTNDQKPGCTETVEVGEEEPFAFTQQPADFEGAINDMAVFTVATNRENVTYQWQYSNNGGKYWSNSGASGNKTASLQVRAERYRIGQMYRCVAVCDGVTLISESATLLPVRREAIDLTNQSADAYAAPYEVVEFTVKAAGENLKYQWQYSNNGGKYWSNSSAEGATTDTLAVTMYPYRDGQMYRCVITNGSETIISHVGTLLLK